MMSSLFFLLVVIVLATKLLVKQNFRMFFAFCEALLNIIHNRGWNCKNKIYFFFSAFSLSHDDCRKIKIENSTEARKTCFDVENNPARIQNTEMGTGMERDCYRTSKETGPKENWLNSNWMFPSEGPD